MKGTLLPLTLALALCSQGASAESHQDLTELPLEELLKLRVISTPKFATKAEDIPSAVSILSAEDIRAFGWRTLADALRSLQGFTVTDDHTYSYAGVRGVSVPGDYRSRFQVLIDGTAINENIYSSATIDSAFPLDLDLVDHIEVVRGPSASVFGGDSMFGVINVITRSGRSVGGAEAALSMGTGRSNQLRGTWGGVSANGTDYLFSLTGFEADGHNVRFPEMASLGLDPVARGTDGESGGKVLVRLRHDEWYATLIHSRRKRTVPTGSYGSVFNDPAHHEDDEYSLAEAGNDLRLDGKNELHTRLYLGRYRYQGYYPYDYPPYVVNHDDAEGRWWGLESRLVSTAWSRQRWTVGFEYKRNTRQNQLNDDIGVGCFGAGAAPCLDDRRNGRQFSVYLQDEISLQPETQLTLGLRHDKATDLQSHWSSRLGLVHHSERAGTFKLLYATAFRDPSVYERYYTTATYPYGNPNLTAERMQSVEGTWEQRLGGGRLTLTGYVFRVQDMIATEGSGVAQNFPTLTARGVEVEYEKRWDSQASLRLGYSLQMPQGDNGRPDNAPRHMAKFNWAYPVGGDWLAGVEAQTVSRRRSATGTGEVGGYGIANLSMVYQPKKHHWEASVGLYNLFDKEYADPVATDSLMPVPRDRMLQNGRNVRLKMTVHF
ncbi:MAG: TonB-dependent receptor plug domain-containing protein [Sulfuricellaceae bacterium]|jgi:outer membrane receptor protein involved in Fe transport